MWVNDAESNTLTFGRNTFSGFSFQDTGTNFNAFTCVSSDDNVYVFGSDNSLSSPSGSSEYYYLCMRITKVTENSYYYYLLGELNTDTFPHIRATKSSVRPSSSSSLPPCDICSDKNDGNTEASFLRRETVLSVPSVTADPLCLPCNKTQIECDITAETTTPAEPITTKPEQKTRHGHCWKKNHRHP
ncbi:uncharacterized protein LOC134726921 [Mytilus trossulus]|uniref:uncharacterized protein LOC134726921 n=1 Tax=Mytilus trossulus TaxID=6551 RepID=UPI0030078EA9